MFQKDDGNFQIEQPVQSEIGCGVGEYTHRLERVGHTGVAWIQGRIPDPNGEAVEYRIALRLPDGEPALGVDVEVNWKSEAARLRLKLDACMDASVNAYEVPFGVTWRKSYAQRFNSRGEWPAYRFVCMEEPRERWGLALINCGTAGVEACDGVLYTTLLRAPAQEYAGMVPDETSSEHGVRNFHFLLMPYENGWQDSGVIEMAQRSMTQDELEKLAEYFADGQELYKPVPTTKDVFQDKLDRMNNAEGIYAVYTIDTAFGMKKEWLEKGLAAAPETAD